MEKKMKGGMSLGVIILLFIVVGAAWLFLTNDTGMHLNNEINSQPTSEQNAGEKARQGVGNAKETVSQALPEGQKSPDCVDYRDGGDDIFTKGSTYSKGSLRQEYCNFADATPNTHVNEFSCNKADPIADNRVKCPDGYMCSDGACVTKPNAQNPVEMKKAEEQTVQPQTGTGSTGTQVSGAVATGS